MNKGIGSNLFVRSGGNVLKKQNSLKDILNAKNEATWAKVDKHGVGQAEWIDNIVACPVYYPTKEEFADPLQYLQTVAPMAMEFGMCKIVSPIVAFIPAGVVLKKELTNFKFTTRTQPLRIANWDSDDMIAFPMSGRNYTLGEYEKLANKIFARKFSSVASLPSKFVEVEFWKELVSGKIRNVEYACDIDGSAFSTSIEDPLGQSLWNLKGFSQLPKSTLRLLETSIPGVTDPMLYIGMLFSTFAWHIEDHYLYSINYHHFGAPKTWYGVPGHAAPEFEKVVGDCVYDLDMVKNAKMGLVQDLLLGKTTMFSPKLLSENGVPVFRAVQYPGEFVITFPRAYHAGFSHGFNCGEAVNFATADWFPYGAAACLRYGFLNREPLLPHDELLCKAAMEIYNSSEKIHTEEHKKCVKVAFLRVMIQQLYVRRLLQQKGAQITTSNVATVRCGRCKHFCYVSHVMCKCYSEPACLNHGEISGCICGDACFIHQRDNFPELEAAAWHFAQEKGILSSALTDCGINDSLGADVWSVVKLAKAMWNDEFGLGIVELVEGRNSNASCREKASHISLLPHEDGVGQRLTSVKGEESCKSQSLPKQHDQESDTEEEAFQVKRRRFVLVRSKRFQVDEEGLDEQGLLPRTPQVEKEDLKHSEPCNMTTESSPGQTLILDERHGVEECGAEAKLSHTLKAIGRVTSELDDNELSIPLSKLSRKVKSIEGDNNPMQGEPVLKVRVKGPFAPEPDLHRGIARNNEQVTNVYMKADSRKPDSVPDVFEGVSREHGVNGTCLDGPAELNNREFKLKGCDLPSSYTFDDFQMDSRDAPFPGTSKRQHEVRQSSENKFDKVKSYEGAWRPNQDALSSYAGHGGGKQSFNAVRYMFSRKSNFHVPCVEKCSRISDSAVGNIREEGHLRRAIRSSPEKYKPCSAAKNDAGLKQRITASDNFEGAWRGRQSEKFRGRQEWTPTERYCYVRGSHHKQGCHHQGARSFKRYHHYNHSKKGNDYHSGKIQLRPQFQAVIYENEKMAGPSAGAKNRRANFSEFDLAESGDLHPVKARDTSEWGASMPGDFGRDFSSRTHHSS